MIEINKNSLWLTFRLESRIYCVLSDYIKSIVVPSSIESVSDSPATIAGVIRHGNDLIRVVEMRELFGRTNLKKSIDDFSVMKEMHISWVADLKRYVHEGGTFTKPVDPHLCTFGLWYDQFHTDNLRLNRLLKKIKTPHENIHHCGAQIMRMKADPAVDHQEEILALMEEADRLCTEEIVPLLERLIEVYSSINRGVVVVVSDGRKQAGLLVDEVSTLIPCGKTQLNESTGTISRSSYIGRIISDAERIMMEIDVEEVLGMV